MADITTFYPGGNANAAVPHATDAVNSVNADQVDFVLNDGSADTDETGFKFWVGAEADVPATRDDNTLYIFTS